MDSRCRRFVAVLFLVSALAGCDTRPALDGAYRDASLQGQVVLSERKMDDGAGGTQELSTVTFGVAAAGGGFRFVFESADVLLEGPTVYLEAPYGGWLGLSKTDYADERERWRVSGSVEIPNTEPYDAGRTRAWMTVDGFAQVDLRGEALAIVSTATVYRELAFPTEWQPRAPYVESGTFAFTLSARRDESEGR